MLFLYATFVRLVHFQFILSPFIQIQCTHVYIFKPFHSLLQYFFLLIVLLSLTFTSFGLSFFFNFYDFRNDKFSMNEFDFTDIFITFRMILPQIIHSLSFSLALSLSACTQRFSLHIRFQFFCCHWCCVRLQWIEYVCILLLLLFSFISMVLTSMQTFILIIHIYEAGIFPELMLLPALSIRCPGICNKLNINSRADISCIEIFCRIDFYAFSTRLEKCIAPFFTNAIINYYMDFYWVWGREKKEHRLIGSVDGLYGLCS